MTKRKMTSKSQPRTPKKSKRSRIMREMTPARSCKAAALVNPIRNAGPLPSSYAVSLKTYGFAAVTAAAPYKFLRHIINAPGDPQSTLTTNQPLGYDQLSDLFNRYRVVGGSFKVNIFNRSSTVICDAVAYVGTVDRSGSTDAIEYMEQPGVPRSQSCVLGQQASNFSRSFSVADVCGVDSSVVLSEETYSSTTGASGPGTDIFLNVGVWSHDGSTSPTYNYTYEIVYDVIFYDLKNLAKS